MDLATALSAAITLSPQRRAELVKRHNKGTLTSEEKEEIKQHLLQAAQRLGDEIRTAESLIKEVEG